MSIEENPEVMTSFVDPKETDAEFENNVETATEVENDVASEGEGVSKDQLREKIKKHGETLQRLQSAATKVNEQRQALNNQLAQIVTESKLVQGAIAELQDLLGERPVQN